MMKKTLVTGGVAAIVLALSAISVGTATAAEASAANGAMRRAAHSFSAPTVYSPPISWLERDTPVDVLCFVEGQRPPNSESMYWFKIRDTDGTASFVHKDAIAFPQSAARPCPNT